MFEHLLVPLDGSTLADAALDLALTFARDGRRDLTCCHAVDTRGAFAPATNLAFPYDPTPLVEALKRQGEAILADARDRAAAAGVQLATRLIFDDPVSATIRTADECGADVILIGTNGRNGLEHAFLGSTAEGVLRGCTIPVITLRAAVKPGGGWPFGCALIAVDDADPADAAIELAVEIAIAERIRLVFATVIPTADLLGKAVTYGYDPQPVLDELRTAANVLLARPVAIAREHGLAADTLVAEGEPVAEILRAAEATGAGLIVTGSHGRRGLRRFFLGSVAENLVRAASVPVLVVRTAANRREATIQRKPPRLGSTSL